MAALFAVGRLPAAQYVHCICLMSPVLTGPDNHNTASKAISASQVNVFLKTQLERGGLAPEGQCTSSPPQPRPIWSLSCSPFENLSWLSRNPGEKPGTVMHACNPVVLRWGSHMTTKTS